MVAERSGGSGAQRKARRAIATGSALLALLLGWACSLDRAGSALVVTGTTTTAVGGHGGTESGGGGAGNSAGAVGGTGGAIEQWLATVPDASGTYALPQWLHFTSPSAGKTSQTSSSTLRTGFGPDVARARNVHDTADGWGLAVEPRRTNIVPLSESWPEAGGNATDYWVAGFMPRTPGQPDPAGGTAATLFDSPTPLFSSRFNNDTPIGAASSWAKGVLGPPYPYYLAKTYTPVISPAWRRYAVSCPFAAGCTCTLNTFDTRDFDVGGPVEATAPSSVVAYGLQLEPEGRYPSSYIPTQQAARTREVETLWSDAGAALAPGGFFDVEIEYSPHYGDTDLVAGSQHDLVQFDAADRLYVEATAKNPPDVFPSTDLRICLLVGGQAPLCSGTLVWQRDTRITVHARHGSDSRLLAVTGATSGADVKQGPPGVPFAPVVDVYILSSATGAQEGADLNRVTFNKP